MEKTYVLEGLNCAHCAAKIEQKAKDLPGVQTCALNFINKKLVMELDSLTDETLLTQKLRHIVHTLEPDVTVTEVKPLSLTEKTYLLEGLDCAHCAAKIEEKIKTLEGIDSCQVNFMTKKMHLALGQGYDTDQILPAVQEAVLSLEPDVVIRDLSPETPVSTAARSGDTKEDSHKKRNFILRLVAAAFFFGLGYLFPNYPLFFLLSYLLAGCRVLLKAGKNILRGQVFDENFLMSIATIGAIFLRSYPEAVGVMLFFEIGEYLQDLAVENSRRSISDLLTSKNLYANLVTEQGMEKRDPKTVPIGSMIAVKPGEKVPLDGIITEGSSFVDTSSLTGESVPRKYQVNDEILSGMINMDSLLMVKVTKSFEDSATSKILEMIENASLKKSQTEKLITKFAKYYTPVVVLLAVLISVFPPLFTSASFAESVRSGLVFLVISCPCALVVSVPLGYFAGIGLSSKKGILIKGSQYMETLSNLSTMVLDKTGTLTEGSFEVTHIFTASGITEEQVLEAAAKAESFSNHPIGASILRKYNKDIKTLLLENDIAYNEFSGEGIQYQDSRDCILAGNQKLMERFHIPYEKQTVAESLVYVAVNGAFLGSIIIADTIKKDTPSTLQKLKQQGITRTIMLTGDRKELAEKIGQQIGIDKVYADLLPHEKANQLQKIMSENTDKEKTAFVGDGINDAPSLVTADLGIAMGGIGSDIAVESADIVLMTDEISKLSTAVSIAKKTKRIVYENIIFALSIKAVFLLLGAFHMTSLWFAVFADVGVALIAILNSLRILIEKES